MKKKINKKRPFSGLLDCVRTILSVIVVSSSSNHSTIKSTKIQKIVPSFSNFRLPNLTITEPSNNEKQPLSPARLSSES